MSALISKQSQPLIPVFRVWADQGSHPPVKLDRRVCVIGRREEAANLQLPSPQVSKIHALVVCDARGVYVRDLASTNGTQHNGAPVQEAGLSDQDVLRIGSYTLRCESGFSRDGEPSRDADLLQPRNAMPAAELVGDGVTFRFPADHKTVLIGRRVGCDLRIDEDGVAPVHAIVFQLDGHRYVRDLRTRSGTHLNGARIHQESLSAGDELRIGGVTMRYVSADPEHDDDVPLDGLQAPLLDEPQIAHEDELLLVEMDESRIPLLDDSVASVGDDAAPMPVALEPAPLEASGIALHDSLVSLEDSRAPGTPDVALPDSSILDPHPAQEPSFHGEIVAVAGEVFPAQEEVGPTGGEAPPHSLVGDKGESKHGLAKRSRQVSRKRRKPKR